MIRLNVWTALFTAMGLLWHESGQDFGFFCYRIGWDAFRGRREFRA